MKRTINIILAAAAALVCGACDWLDVTPRSETKESVMFSSEYGYKAALTGVYIRLADAELYGKNMTMYIPETMARNWGIPVRTDDVMNRLANFDYANPGVEEMFEKLWVNYYNAIVQVNDIIDHLKTSTVRFEYDNDALIRGEALGLRAFLHLDLLRLFGPVPSTVTGDPRTIPYVTHKTKELSELMSLPWSQVVANIEDDLIAAAAALEKADPVTLYANDGLNMNAAAAALPLQDEWQYFRQTRFNYYACLGALARLYQWTGQKEQAVQYAKMVVEAQNDDGSVKFPLTSEVNYNTSSQTQNVNVNLSMWNEHLFGVHNPGLQGIVAPLFKNDDASLSQRVENLDIAYEKSVSPDDIRYKPTRHPVRYWEEEVHRSARVNHFRKYTGNELIGADNRVALIRVAEMYLILIENLPLGEAAPYFSTYRSSRSMVAAVEGLSMASEQARMDRVEKEYRKEFFGEGQMFYFYKRQNADRFLWPQGISIGAGSFVPPLPKSQSMFE